MSCPIKKAISGEPSCSKPEYLDENSTFNALPIKEDSRIIALYTYNCFGDKMNHSESLVIHIGSH